MTKPRNVSSATKVGGKRPGSGRPIGSSKLQPTDETIKQIEGLARIQCTQREAGAVLGVCERTFADFLRAHKKALDAWELGKETGKASLRRNQYKMAESNPTMAIWLGKQMLDQTDKQDFTHHMSLSTEFEAFMRQVLSNSGGDDPLQLEAHSSEYREIPSEYPTSDAPESKTIP